MESMEHEPKRDFATEFANYEKKKEQQAQSAEIPGYKTEQDNSAKFDVEPIGNSWTRKLYDGDFFQMRADSKFPALNTVFVQTRDLNTGADNPGDLGGGETDKHLIYEGLSRVAADAVMAGANTIRGSGVVLSVWHPELVALRRELGLPRHPAQIVVTESGRVDMDSELMFNIPQVPVYVLTSSRGAEVLKPYVESRPWVRVYSDETVDMSKLLAQLSAEQKISRISVIGGRTLTSSLIDGGLVKDLYLTTSAINGGEPHTPFYIGQKILRMDRVLRKTGLGKEEGVVFEHLSLVP
ncbi:MAG TPA: dihydrofolate reductase family protein [Patescibacteria group bacterium]|nr:dihydrofolate reductase family protein [Patescibacteria group bacterium]